MSRDDLFQIDVDELQPLAMGMWRLQERPRTRLFVRLDRFRRYVIAYVYFPRDRFSSELREKAGSILEKHYKGNVIEFLPNFGEGTLVRVRYIVTCGLADGDNVDAQVGGAGHHCCDAALGRRVERGAGGIRAVRSRPPDGRLCNCVWFCLPV
jgi:NAD-specific glutamate dehydrogenase